MDAGDPFVVDHKSIATDDVDVDSVLFMGRWSPGGHDDVRNVL